MFIGVCCCSRYLDRVKALFAIVTRVILVACVGCGGQAPPAKPSELPAAGSEKDDGNGLIAEASVTPGQISKPSSELPPLLDKNREIENANGTTSKGGGPYSHYQYAHYKFIPTPPGSIDESRISPYAKNYVVDDRLETGSINGVVRWGRVVSKTIRKLAQVRKDIGSSAHLGCKANALNTPHDTVVMIRPIERGRGFAQFEGYPTRTMQVGGVVEIGVCGISPFVQVVGPLGSTIRGTLHRPGPATLRDTNNSAPQIKMSFGAQGDRRLGQVVKAGPLELMTERGERGWLYVADHPFYVSVDEHGRFVMLDVPVGRYQLVAWHPPLTPGGPPLTTSRRVQVRANKRMSTRLEFSAR